MSILRAMWLMILKYHSSILVIPSCGFSIMSVTKPENRYITLAICNNCYIAVIVYQKKSYGAMKANFQFPMAMKDFGHFFICGAPQSVRPETKELVPDETRDILKKLFQFLVPKQIRHDLGEYYTPEWLAERCLNQVGYGVKERDLLQNFIQNLSIPNYDPKNGTHKELARLSKLCHEKVAAGINVSDLEEQIDELAAELRRSTKEELKDIKESLKEMK